jgi:hypothetical protein
VSAGRPNTPISAFGAIAHCSSEQEAKATAYAPNAALANLPAKELRQ